jgi:cell division protein FtsI/penicillin-binding protein 2
VNGYKVAGKTGTAQKVSEKGGYAPGKYVVSFVGYMPAESPRFVCLVMVDDAKVASGLNYGGLVAAPIFSRIAERAALHLDLVPTEPAIALQPDPISATLASKEDRD